MKNEFNTYLISSYVKLSDGSQVQSWSGQSCHIRNPVMYSLTEKKKETSMLQLINREKFLAII